MNPPLDDNLKKMRTAAAAARQEGRGMQNGRRAGRTGRVRRI
jgi:hypothetical protein